MALQASDARASGAEVGQALAMPPVKSECGFNGSAVALFRRYLTSTDVTLRPRRSASNSAAAADRQVR
jgi:hypothetical protein